MFPGRWWFLFLSGTGVLGLWLIWWMGLPVVDDAAISVAYGLSFWEGYGFRLTHNSGVVEGFTSPAWALLTGLAAYLGENGLPFARWFGAVLGLVGIAMVSLSEALLERRALKRVEAFMLLVSFGAPSLFFWLSSGMETGLHVFVMALAYLLAQSKRVRPELLGAFFASLVLVRPELVVAGALLSAWRHDRLRVILGFGSGLLFLHVLRWLCFGELLPNTWFAKRTWDFGGPQYVWSFVVMHAWSFGGAVVATLVVVFTPLRARLVPVLAIILSGLFFGISAQGDWMREWRFLVWLLPFLNLPLLLAWNSERKRLAVVATVLTVIGAGVQLTRFTTLKAEPEFPASFVMENSRRLKERLDGVGALRPHLGLPDVGGLALVFRESDVSDVAGLADYAMAHAGGTAAMEDYLVNEGPPLAIDAHGPSGHVAFKALKPWFGEGWGHGLATLTGLTREEDPRCPGQKTKLLSDGADQLEVQLRELLEHEQPVQALRLWRCAETYVPEERRLSTARREVLSELARARAMSLENSDPTAALRHWSLATLLAGNEAGLRKRTETLRAALFVGEAKP